MDRQERIDLILDHFEHPRHVGVLDPADVIQQGINPGCGDVITVYLRADGEDGRVLLAFQGEGCTISRAAASMALEMMQGWTLAQIEQASAEPILDALGPDIATARIRCATLGFNVTQEAGRAYRRQRTPEPSTVEP